VGRELVVVVAACGRPEPDRVDRPEPRSEAAASRFVDRAGYAATVLHGAPSGTPGRLPVTIEPASHASLAYGFASLALLTAAAGLWYRRLPELLLRMAARTLGPPVHVLRAAHSGIVGDYILWIAAGTALIGGIWGITLR
jgi:multicomponent Na+:H+ antiporter subunit D